MTDAPKIVATEPKEAAAPDVKKPDVAAPAVVAPAAQPDIAKK